MHLLSIVLMVGGGFTMGWFGRALYEYYNKPKAPTEESEES